MYPRLVNLAGYTPSTAPAVEIIRLTKRDEYYDVQLAINGVLAPSMEVHAAAREKYQDEKSWLQYLTASSETLISVYGDAREKRDLIPYEEAMAS